MKLQGTDGSGIAALHTSLKNTQGGSQSMKKCESVASLFKSVAESDPNDGLSLMRDAHEHYTSDNLVSAVSLYTRAAEQGYVEAQMNAAWLLQRISTETLYLEKRHEAQNKARVLSPELHLKEMSWQSSDWEIGTTTISEARLRTLTTI